MRISGLDCFAFYHVTSRQSPAAAQTYPTGPVQIITQQGVGGGTDVAMRMVTEGLGQMWGQKTVLINQPGAGGALAARSVAEAAPDGHTLFLALASAFVVLPETQREPAVQRQRFCAGRIRRRKRRWRLPCRPRCR